MMFYWLGRFETNVMVTITDGTTGLVGLVLAAKCSILTPVSVVLHTISM